MGSKLCGEKITTDDRLDYEPFVEKITTGDKPGYIIGKHYLFPESVKYWQQTDTLKLKESSSVQEKTYSYEPKQWGNIIASVKLRDLTNDGHNAKPEFEHDYQPLKGMPHFVVKFTTCRAMELNGKLLSMSNPKVFLMEA